MRILRCCAAALIVLGLSIPQVYAEPVELKFGHVGAPGSLFASNSRSCYN